MRVLVVEDNELVRAVLVEVLCEAGMHVTDTADPREALALAPAMGAPALLVADVNLGCDMDGFGLAAAARRRWPGISIVLISGRPGNLHRYALHASDRFLPKPFSGSDLLRTIGELKAVRH